MALLCALTSAPAAGAATFKPISTDGLGLTKTGLDDAAYAQIAALEKTHPKASVGDVIASANRSVRPLGSAPALRAVKNLQGGFRWNTGDDDVSYWYSKNGKGARISFVIADKLSTAKYRHVLLVDRNLKPITTHAGGIAWYGHYLYIAETHVGRRVFDLQHILKASVEGYAYALPQAGTFRTASELTFSFVSVDRATASLLTGEYIAGKAGGRLAQWPLGAEDLSFAPTSGRLYSLTEKPGQRVVFAVPAP